MAGAEDESGAGALPEPGGRKLPIRVPGSMGKPLEWNQETVAASLTAGSAGFVMVVVFFTVRDVGIGWVAEWYLWLYAAFAGLVMWWAYHKDFVAAGAEWVQQKKKWVDTYSLVAVREGVFGAVDRGIVLIDSDGRRVDLKLKAAQSNPALWDLVYNGIRHSVAGGACEISASTCEMLDIPSKYASPESGYSTTWLFIRCGFFAVVAAFGVAHIVGGDSSTLTVVGLACVALSLWAIWKFVSAYRQSNRRG